MPCPKGLHWNDRLKLCAQPANANCVEVSNITKPVLTPNIPITESVTDEPSIPISPSAESENEAKEEKLKIICYCELNMREKGNYCFILFLSC